MGNNDMWNTTHYTFEDYLKGTEIKVSHRHEMYHIVCYPLDKLEDFLLQCIVIPLIRDNLFIAIP